MSCQPRDPVKRFFNKVSQSSGCWEWLGAKTPTGYGKLSVEGKLMYAHRFSYKFHFGNFDESLLVCHHCDNTSCVNPCHLFLGTSDDNVKDMVKKGRAQRGSLSCVEIKDIITRRTIGESNRNVAKQYGVCEALISMINNRKRYRRELNSIMTVG